MDTHIQKKQDNYKNGYPYTKKIRITIKMDTHKQKNQDNYKNGYPYTKKLG